MDENIPPSFNAELDIFMKCYGETAPLLRAGLLDSSNSSQTASSIESIISRLTTAFKQLPEIHLLHYTENCLLGNCANDPVTFLKAVLLGSKHDIEFRVKVLKCAFRLFSSSSNDGALAKRQVPILISELDVWPADMVIRMSLWLVDNIIQQINCDANSLELFARMISLLVKFDAVKIEEKPPISGEDLKIHLVNKICNSKWDPKYVANLVSMFREIPLDSDEQTFVLKKIVCQLSLVNSEVLPSLVYQMLLLASLGHRRLVIEAILRHFSSLVYSRNVPDGVQSDVQMRQIDGTVILHIEFAVKQDRELGKELLRYIRASPCAFTSFTVALLLCIGHIHRFSDDVFSILKGYAIHFYSNRSRRKDAAWMENDNSDSRYGSNMDADHVVMTTVRNSVQGWDHMSQSLVRFGILLVDSYAGAKASATVPAEAARSTCHLGVSILIETFKVHSFVRRDLLDEVLSRIINRCPAVDAFVTLLGAISASMPQIMLQFLQQLKDALSYLSTLPSETGKALLSALMPIMLISVSFRDSAVLVLQKTMFSRETGARLVAVEGFLSILRNFVVRDFECIVDDDDGCGSVSSSSQFLSSSQLTNRNTLRNNSTLCLEVLGSLRRSLTQQMEVRRSVYAELFSVIEVNPHLTLPVIDIVAPHLELYLAKEGNNNTSAPFTLDKCIQVGGLGGQTHIIEPLADLLSLVQKCLLLLFLPTVDDDLLRYSIDEISAKMSKPRLKLLKAVFDKCAVRMRTCDLADFNIDTNAPFSRTSGVGVENYLRASILLGLYEAWIEYCFRSASESVNGITCDDSRVLLELFERRGVLVALLRGKEAAGTSRKKRAADEESIVDSDTQNVFASKSKTARSKVSKRKISESSMLVVSSTASVPSTQRISYHLENISFDTLIHIAKFVFSCTSESSSLLRNNVAFCTTIVEACKVRVEKLAKTSTGWCKFDSRRSVTLRHFTELSCVLVQPFVLLRNPLHNFDARISSQEKNKCKEKPLSSLITAGNECFVSATLSVDALSNDGNGSDMARYLSEVNDSIGIDSNDGDISILSRSIVRTLQETILRVLTDNLQCDNRTVFGLFSVIESLIFPSAGIAALVSRSVDITLASSTLKWLHSLISEHVTEGTLIFTTMSLLLRIALVLPVYDGIEMVYDIADDLHLVLGDVTSHEAGVARKFSCINLLSAQTVLSQLIASVNSATLELTWAVNSLPDIVGCESFEEEMPSSAPRIGLEKRIHDRTIVLINLMRSMLLSIIPPPLRTNLFKALVKVYVLLQSLVKKCIVGAHVGGHLGIENSQGLLRLIRISSKLKEPLDSCLVSYGTSSSVRGDQPHNLSRIVKEGKIVPSVIFALEQYERYLIKLSKKTKVDYMKYMQRSTSRDFKVNKSVLEQALLENAEDSDDGNSTKKKTGKPNRKRSNLNLVGEK